MNLNHLNKEQMEKFYKAMQNLVKIIQNPKNEHWIGLKTDQVLVFDNFRLLHGRSAINGKRTLVTAYCSRDDWVLKCSQLDIFI